MAAAQPGQVVLAAAGDLLARHADLPLVGGIQAGDQVQQGGPPSASGRWDELLLTLLVTAARC